MATSVSDLKFFEDGFLGINATGTTASNSVSALICLTDISLSYDNDTLEIQHAEDNFNKQYINTSSSWTAEASFSYSEATGSGQLDFSRYSGDTKLLSGANKVINASQLFELAKVKNKQYPLIVRLSTGNYQKGMVIITNVSLEGSVGAFKTGSISFQGAGALAKVA